MTVAKESSYTCPPKYNDSKSQKLISKDNIEQTKSLQKPSYSFPPKHTITTISKNMESDNLQEQDDDGSYDDSNNDPNWKSKSVFDMSSDDDIINGTPSKITEFTKELHSPRDNWSTSKHRHTTLVAHSPATDKWTVDNTFETFYNEGLSVKRALFKDDEDPCKKPGLPAVTSVLLSSSQLKQKVQYKTTEAFQTFVVNTLVNLKHEINNISNVVQSNHLNIDCLLANANKYTSVDLSNIEKNINYTFPIENDADLYTFENKIKLDNGFRESWIMKLSVLTDNNDLGNSVRRVIGRMFNDNVLVNYSLFGFKKKQCFSSLLSYRLIIDAIRTNIKYKHIPEKDIDNCLGIWLSHAPFRVKKKNSKQPDNQYQPNKL